MIPTNHFCSPFVHTNAAGRIASHNKAAVLHYQRGNYQFALVTLKSALFLLRENQADSQRYVCQAVSSVTVVEDPRSPFSFYSRPFVFVEATEDKSYGTVSDSSCVLQVALVLYNLGLVYHAIGRCNCDISVQRDFFGRALILYHHAHLAMKEAEEVWDFNQTHHFSLFLAVCNNAASINFEQHQFGEVNRWMDFVVRLSFCDEYIQNLDAEDFDFFFTASLVLREAFEDRLFSMAPAA